jgi:hypothetical protein
VRERAARRTLGSRRGALRGGHLHPSRGGTAALRGRLARLDRELRAADPALGVREVEALAEAAARHGLALETELAMPEEGDVLLVFRKGRLTSASARCGA